MALVEDQHDVAGEAIELLNGGDDDLGVGVFELLLEDSGASVAVCGALLELVVLPHGLVVEIFAVDDEQDLIDVWQLADELGGLEAGQGLA